VPVGTSEQHPGGTRRQAPLSGQGPAPATTAHPAPPRATLPRRPHVTVSALGLGASQGGNLGQVTSDEEFAAAVDHAWAAGIRDCDSAPHYGLGLADRRLGAALRGAAPSEFTVSRNVGRLLVPSPRTAHESGLPVGGFEVPATHRRVWDFSRDGVLRSL